MVKNVGLLKKHQVHLVKISFGFGTWKENMVRWKGQLPQIPAMRWLSLTRGGLEPVFKMVSSIKPVILSSYYPYTTHLPPSDEPWKLQGSSGMLPTLPLETQVPKNVDSTVWRSDVYHDVQWCFVPLRGMIDGSHPA
jgi:hypothetical protein